MHIYDYIVIGSGLTGLNVAARVSQETSNILLIESDLYTQGSSKPVQFANQTIDNGLRFFPGSSLGQKALTQLEDFLGLKLISSIEDNFIETYEASGFKSFAGFGNHAPEFYDQISYFLNSKEIKTTLPWYKIAELLNQKYLGKTIHQSYVTSFNSTNGKITHVTVNGNSSKTYYAHNFIFAGSARDLVHVLSDDLLGQRAKSKLKKDTAWVGLCLDLYHETPSSENEGAVSAEEVKSNLFLLEGTTNDSIGPCIGRFNGDVSPHVSSNISQWISFIDLEFSEETENIAELLKKVKRQIKRAFPEKYEAIKAERLFITPPMSVGELKLNANGTLPKADNLWIASAQVNQQPNLLGSLLQAQFILSSLGFAPAEQTMEVSQETL
jgi:NAD(P)-binding Rossmann-like domain